jgi:hypothetical protein
MRNNRVCKCRLNLFDFFLDLIFSLSSLLSEESKRKPGNVQTRVAEGSIRWLGGADEAKHVRLVAAPKRRSVDTALVE